MIWPLEFKRWDISFMEWPNPPLFSSLNPTWIMMAERGASSKPATAMGLSLQYCTHATSVILLPTQTMHYIFLRENPTRNHQQHLLLVVYSPPPPKMGTVIKWPLLFGQDFCNFEFAGPVSSRSAEKPSLSRHCTKAPPESSVNSTRQWREGFKARFIVSHILHVWNMYRRLASIYGTCVYVYIYI